MGPVDLSVLNVPQGGQCKTVRESMAVATERPVPGGGRPRPKPRVRTVTSLPRVRAMYDYEAQDLDEISLKEGEVLELVKEGKLLLIFLVLSQKHKKCFFTQYFACGCFYT